jgi:tripartite-type tricarboxylate transporter receptor subunit TctC
MTRLGLFAALFTAATLSLAQNYPTRPVRLIVGFPPGGAVDLLARITAPRLGEKWGQQVVVDNRPGAGSRIAAEIAAKAAPDGYTLLMITSSHAVGAGLYGKLAYHPVDSFAAVTLVGSTPLVVLTHPSLPVKSVKDLIALAKARPGQLNFGSSGTGGITHLAGELFKGMTGINIVHVPYKGTGPAFTDFIAGQVELMFPALPGALPHVKAGRVRAVAMSSAKRSPALPAVPTVVEAGVAGYEVTNWYGLLAPAGTDAKIVGRLHDEFAAVLTMSDVAEAFARAGAEPLSSMPRDFEAYLRSEVARWTKVIKDAGVKVE